MADCLNCGKPTGRNKYYCSQKCRAEHLKNYRNCVICGKKFWAPPSSVAKTCSRECESLNRKRQEEKAKRNLELAHEAASTSPNTMSCETNINAKSYVIMSPDGKKYEISNLKLWCEENAEILPSSPELFKCGIYDIKRSMKGNRKYPSFSYKGWTLISFSEENNARKRKGLPEKRAKRPKRIPKADYEEHLQKRRKRANMQYKKRKDS